MVSRPISGAIAASYAVSAVLAGIAALLIAPLAACQQRGPVNVAADDDSGADKTDAQADAAQAKA